MGIIELLLLAVGLSMDAFSVSVCKGLALKRADTKSCLICGIWFGAFQGMMPFIGYLLGTNFERYITAIAPWIAFVLLVLIGGNMIKESFGSECDVSSAYLDVKTMFAMSVATSIDALAVGITFACVPVEIIAAGTMVNAAVASVIICVTTFVISAIGVKIGNIFSGKYKTKAELAGGIILIGIGIKILAEHLFF